jgi:thiamine pyrophosphate-dependent acetolactate synthase large subunit-like protein
MSFGQRLVELLKQESVEVIFAQGDLSMKDIQLHGERQDIKLVGPRHESSAIFMASGYYCMTGKPQVAIGAIGPGVANLLPAAICAAQENIPVIIFGSRRQSASDRAVRKGRWLHAPMFNLFAEVCKFAAIIDHPEKLDEVVQEAFRQALSGTPGPVYIEYDYAIHALEWSFPPLLPPSRYRVGPLGADEVSVNRAVDMLIAAKSTILLAGEDVVRTRNHASFERLARLLDCPVITTMGGTGALAETHPQWLMHMSPAGHEAIADADLMLAVGTCFPEMLNYGRLRHFSVNDQNRKVIVLDRDTASVGTNRPVDIALIGHPSLTIDQLANALEKRNYKAPPTKTAKLRKAYEENRVAMIASIPRTNKIFPSRLMLEAREAVPDDAIIVLDGGLTILYKLTFFEQRSREFLYTSTFSHLGIGLGYALGAQLAAGRDKPVCLISGDGALGFHFMEFETLVRHQLPVVVIINDDQALGAEMAAHMDHIGHPLQVTFCPVRYDEMARAIGGHGEYVDREEDIQPAIRRAFASGKPAIVQVAVDQDASHAYMPPYVMDLVSWLEADPEAYLKVRQEKDSIHQKGLV